MKAAIAAHEAYKRAHAHPSATTSNASTSTPSAATSSATTSSAITSDASTSPSAARYAKLALARKEWTLNEIALSELTRDARLPPEALEWVQRNWMNPAALCRTSLALDEAAAMEEASCLAEKVLEVLRLTIGLTIGRLTIGPDAALDLKVDWNNLPNVSPDRTPRKFHLPYGPGQRGMIAGSVIEITSNDGHWHEARIPAEDAVRRAGKTGTLPLEAIMDRHADAVLARLFGSADSRIAAAHPVSRSDAVEASDTLDFIKGKACRYTVVCKAGVAVRRSPSAYARRVAHLPSGAILWGVLIRSGTWLRLSEDGRNSYEPPPGSSLSMSRPLAGFVLADGTNLYGRLVEKAARQTEELPPEPQERRLLTPARSQLAEFVNCNAGHPFTSETARSAARDWTRDKSITTLIDVVEAVSANSSSLVGLDKDALHQAAQHALLTSLALRQGGDHRSEVVRGEPQQPQRATQELGPRTRPQAKQEQTSPQEQPRHKREAPKPPASLGELVFRAARDGDAKVLKKLLVKVTKEKSLVLRRQMRNWMQPADAAEAGATPLCAATTSGHYEAARQLLDAHYSASKPRADGMTPLLLAVARGHLGLTKLLLDSGADPSAKAKGADGAAQRALEVAIEKGYGEIEALLRQRTPQSEDRLQSGDRSQSEDGAQSRDGQLLSSTVGAAGAPKARRREPMGALAAVAEEEEEEGGEEEEEAKGRKELQEAEV